ncbi:MAG: ring-cleaving dioxygenase [Ignavibacteriales bacterium]|nr:MAG: ring-cleaving dioxygenase [Ignavibacteriales bacterium]
MNHNINGIHHITAIAGNPQSNYNFYVKNLGLRFIKKTVNFDDPYTYHLYYGDEAGNPGTILTFFPWLNAVKGKKGSGQITTISFSILPSSIDFWMNRLRELNIETTGPFKRFNEDVIIFYDEDEFELELVASLNEKRKGWANGDIPVEHSIKGFYGVTTSLTEYSQTQKLLTEVMGFKKISEEQNRIRFESNDAGPSSYYDILHLPGNIHGRMGIGAVHHIAWRTHNDETQSAVRNNLLSFDMHVTPIVDRNYFHSIYFREPGNVLFEVATDPPGFTVDEPLEQLGRQLKLPSWYENDRQSIEKALPQLITE